MDVKYGVDEWINDVVNNSTKGTTIGPSVLPSPFIPSNFLDTLSSYTAQSRLLGWIKDDGTANKYLGYFSSAKTLLQAGSVDSVRQILNTIVSSAIGDSTANITSEAYALLRFNTEYLLQTSPSIISASFADTHKVAIVWHPCALSSFTNGYDVYRSVYYDGSTASYAKVNSSTIYDTTYMDRFGIPGTIPTDKQVYLRYDVVALASNGSSSLPSDVYSLYAGRTVSGSIAGSTTWNENKIVVADVTVGSGASLTLAGGITVYFASGKSLIFNGNISVNSSASSRTIFDRCDTTGSWGSIQFNAGGTGAVQYCSVYHANAGIYFNGASVHDITYCDVSNCKTYGIELYYANGTASLISHSKMTHNGQYGLYCYASSPTLYYDTIQYNYYGFMPNYYCASILGGPGTPPSAGHNIIAFNTVGVLATGSSTPLLGIAASNTAGYNCLHSNTSVDFICMYCGTVYAQNNFWSNPLKIGISNGTIYYTPSLSTDPNCITQNPQPNALTAQAQDTNISTMVSMSLSGNPTGALSGLKELYKKSAGKDSKRDVLVQMLHTYGAAHMDGFIDYLRKEVRPQYADTDQLYALTMDLEGMSLIEQGEFKKAVENSKLLASKFKSNTEIYKRALFDLGYIQSFLLNDKSGGRKYFDELMSRYPADDMTQQAKYLLGN